MGAHKLPDAAAPFMFQPGASGNAGGRPKLPADIVEARKISQFEFERIVNKFLFMNDDEFKDDLARKEATKFERLIGGIIECAIRKKDEKKAEWLLSRTLGKMRDKLDISSESKSLKVSINASTTLPAASLDSLESGNLTLEQLETFSDKVAKIKAELRAKQEFAEVVDVESRSADDAEGNEG